MTATAAFAPAVAFDVDAMLMYGWVADANRNVTHVSNSLRRWIRDHILQAPTANALLDRVLAGKADVPVPQFIGSLLDPATESETPELVDEYMTRLEERIADRKSVLENTRERRGDYTVLLQHHQPERGERPLCGARFVRDSATLLASRWNRERVDIVVVAIVEPDGGWWRIKGFQGQLQEAWVRVRNRVIDGNQAGGIALMARNLSHNIGSHALYWVASDASEDHRRFLSYLQSRMELVAGFATRMPLSPVTANVKTITENLERETLLLGNICRSESISDIRVRYEGGDQQAVFFGGALGVHAFYSVLENCIRDTSKHSPRNDADSHSLTMHVKATELEQFIQIDVHDEAGTYDRHGAELAAWLDGIRIADESGKLDPQHWGIKERFVCAAMLRGFRPEDFPQQESGTPQRHWLGVYSRSDKRVLQVVNIDGNCGWRFFLPRRRADVLLVTDREVNPVPIDAEVQTFAEFERAVASPTQVTAPFVVLEKLPLGHDVDDLAARLPHRTFVVDPSVESQIRTIDAPLEAITQTALLERSVDSLKRRPVRLVLAIRSVETGGILQWGATLDDPPAVIIDDQKLDQEIDAIHAAHPDDDLVVIKRHAHEREQHNAFLLKAESRNVVHFELYRQRPIVKAAIVEMQHDPRRGGYRLLEAALTKILVVDERLDLSINTRKDTLARQELHLRGITVRGAEFAGHAAQPRAIGLEEFAKWGRGFHFVILHRGVAEKLFKRDGTIGAEEIVRSLEAQGARVVIHSGRMGMSDMPSRTKFLSLANVSNWIDQGSSKLQIVEELFSLRRV